jgi:putative oxidoreductase
MTPLSAALLLIVDMDMAVTILSTKIPILLGHGDCHFVGPSPTKPGLWSMLHEARTDLSMLLASVFLLLVGSGRDGPEGRRQDKRA